MELRIDNRVAFEMTSKEWPGFGSEAEQAFEVDNEVVDALRRGANARLEINGRSASVTLAGSGQAIALVEQMCADENGARKFVPTQFGDRSMKSPFEAAMELHQYGAELGRFRKLSETDLWGGDIRTGLEDPWLRQMTESYQCEALCKLTSECRLYTYHEPTGTCSLKNGFEERKFSKNAESAQFEGEKHALQPPPTSGPGVQFLSDVHPRLNESSDVFSERLRMLSKPLAATCQNEITTLERELNAFEVSRPRATGTVGDPTVVAWSGNFLETRIPVWIMVSSSQPVRFSGEGFWSLAPGAPNPFGITTALTDTRALTALFARGAGEQGGVGVVPLRAGETTINVRLVAYLRDCDREVAIREADYTIEVDPAKPEIVLTDAGQLENYDRHLNLAQSDRRIDYNEKEFLIRSGDGTEILRAAGQNLGVSPTQRFLAVEAEDEIDIYDVIDGAHVARLPAGTLAWALSDSIAVSSTSPWAKVHLRSLFNDSIKISDVLTGPSCCTAIGADALPTRVGIDQENAVITIWGSLGYHLASLQNPDYRIHEGAGSGYMSTMSNSLPLIAFFYESIGAVAPVSPVQRISFVGPVTETHTYTDDPYVPPELREKKRFHVSELRLSRVGLASLQNQIDDDAGLSSGSGDPDAQLLLNLERLGIKLAPAQESEILMPYDTGGGEVTDVEFRDKRKEDYSAVFSEIEEAGENAGYSIEWARQDASFECDQFDLRSWDRLSEPGNPSYRRLPQDIDVAHRFSIGDRNLYLLRASCVAAATGGTMRGSSALLLVDSEHPERSSASDKVVIADSYFSFANREKLPYDFHFTARISDNLLFLFTPGKAAVMVYDLHSKGLLSRIDNLPSGNLLENIHLTADRQHMVQSNSDGGVFIHDIASGSIELSGRIVDDEIALWDSAFNFDATSEAASLIDLRFPGLDGQFSLDRFDSSRRLSGLVEKALDEQYRPQSRHLNVPPQLDGFIAEADGDVSIVANIDNSDRASSLDIYQEGVLTASLDFENGTVERVVPRLRGARWFTMVARDAEGLASLPISADLGPDPRGKSRQQALVVGVDRYSDPNLATLNYAKSDAVRFHDALAAESEGATETTILTDRRADAASILDAARRMVNTLEPGDHGMLFFAGHGLQDEQGNFYFGTTGTDLSDLSGTALAWTDLASVLAGSKAKLTVLLDACHSGAAGTTAFASNDRAVSGLSAVPSNITILSASKGRQLSQESSELGGGLFTAGLVNTLHGDRASNDVNGNNAIEVSELYRGVKSFVSSRAGLKQTPWISRNRVVGDYAAF